MFRIGEEIICVKNTDDKIYLEIGKTYTITNRAIDKKGNGYVYVNDSNYHWKESNFLSIPRSRELKILKLKKRICLKLEVK